MGLFSKDKQKQTSKSEQNASDAEETHPLLAIAYAIAETPDPVTSLAMVITTLVRGGAITLEGLELLGLTTDELVTLVTAVDNFEGVETFNYELQVQAALRAYDRELALLAAERGIQRDSELFTAFRSSVADFAAENNLTDIRVAYWLMLAECPGKIPSAE